MIGWFWCKQFCAFVLSFSSLLFLLADDWLESHRSHRTLPLFLYRWALLIKILRTVCISFSVSLFLPFFGFTLFINFSFSFFSVPVLMFHLAHTSFNIFSFFHSWHSCTPRAPSVSLYHPHLFFLPPINSFSPFFSIRIFCISYYFLPFPLYSFCFFFLSS